MLRVRRLEESIVGLAERDDLIRGHTHVSIGQEAAAAAAALALRDDDYLFTTHRNHGHVLARGGEPMRILAEILGRTDGYSGGRAGSLHVSAPRLGILHTSAIVGASIPLAAGAAFAAKRTGSGRVALAFFGDGAMEEGVFSETMNIAQLWRLPVVFLMENNSVSPNDRQSSGRGSPTSEHSARALSDVPRAYGIATRSVDGANADAMVSATCDAVDATRSGNGPCFIESRTSRWPGNYGSAPTLSLGGETDISWAWSPESAPEPVRRWVDQSDPVLMCARDVLRDVERSRLLAIDGAVREEMAAALEAAKRSLEPSPETAFEFVRLP